MNDLVVGKREAETIKYKRNSYEVKNRDNGPKQKCFTERKRIETMRTDFIANISHELKTPIALISGYAEALQDNLGNPESTVLYSDIIIKESKKMNEILQDLIILSDLEKKCSVVKMEKFDLAQQISGSTGELKRAVQEKGLTLMLNSEDHVFVWADEYLVEEVYRCYMKNALEYCGDNGHIEVTIAKTKDRIRVSVFNTGEPIGQSDLPRIWERFYKVDKSHSRDNCCGGAGIGLSIVQLIMNTICQNFGVRNVKSGVEFWFELEKYKEGV